MVKDLEKQIMIAGIFGKVDAEEMHAMLQVAAGAPPLRPCRTDMNGRIVIVADTPLNTLDAQGNPLRVDRNYLLDGKPTRIRGERFGSGNLMDTWYWVDYLDADLKEQFVVVQGKYRGSFFSAPSYESRFRPISEDK